MVKRKSVQSSVISSLGYNVKTLTLEIEFNSGHIWQYYGVRQKVYRDMINSDSLGQFFNENIKGVYSEARVR